MIDYESHASSALKTLFGGTPDVIVTDSLNGRSRLIPVLTTIANIRLSKNSKGQVEIGNLLHTVTESIGNIGTLPDIAASVFVSSIDTLLTPRLMSTTNSFPEELPDQCRTTDMGITSFILASILLPTVLSGTDVRKIQAVYTELNSLTLDQLTALDKLLTLPDRLIHITEQTTFLRRKSGANKTHKELREQKVNEILRSLDKARIGIGVKPYHEPLSFFDTYHEINNFQDGCLAVYLMADDLVSELRAQLVNQEESSEIAAQTTPLFPQVIKAMIFNRTNMGSQVSWELAISILDTLISSSGITTVEEDHDKIVNAESTFVLDKLLTTPGHFFDAAIISTTMCAHMISVLEDIKPDNPAMLPLLDKLSRQLRLRFEAGLSPIIATMGIDINLLIEMEDLVTLSDKKRQAEVGQTINSLKKAYKIRESRPGRVVRQLRKQLEQIITESIIEDDTYLLGQKTLIGIVAISFYQALGFTSIQFSSIPMNRIIFSFHFSRIKGLLAMIKKHNRPLKNGESEKRFIPSPEEVHAIIKPLNSTTIPLSLEKYRLKNGDYDIAAAKTRLQIVTKQLQKKNISNSTRLELTYEEERLRLIDLYVEFRRKLEPMIFDAIAFTLIIGLPEKSGRLSLFSEYKSNFDRQEDFCENITIQSHGRLIVLEIEDIYLSGYSFPFMKAKVLQIDEFGIPLRIFEMKVITGANSRDEHWTRALRDYPSIPDRIIRISQQLTPTQNVYDIANKLN
ncbi:hypothetical protein KC660_02030 [Candidatus Dojkabacteria bacterium]|uniref:Uncharacterized protein n=1 Tax=Candidatus Dojkabacteria bacterium TaxID=2099670 RepID=A0A955L3C2_9BACT|nr:hypothetical protein [Candidatus Dojkabacteria bacterium]